MMKPCAAFGVALALSVLLPQAAVAQGWAGGWTAAPEAQVIRATYFDDGNDKMAIADLRARAAGGEPLTEEERAILRAANRIGEVQFPGCVSEDGLVPGGNAFLVQVGGRDAVVTSAHVIVDEDERQFLHGCTIDDLRQGLYFPHLSYLDLPLGAAPLDGGDPVLQTVGATLDDSLGVPSQRTMIIDDPTDYVVLFLDEQISHLPSLDGQVRGAFQLARFPRFGEQPIVMLGFDPSFMDRERRIAPAWQTCLGRLDAGRIRHTCDTVPGVSGSLIALFEEGDFRAVALHSSGVADQGDILWPLPATWFEWNSATPASALLHALERQGR